MPMTKLLNAWLLTRDLEAGVVAGFNRHISLDDNSYRFYPRLCFSSSMYVEFSWNSDICFRIVVLFPVYYLPMTKLLNAWLLTRDLEAGVVAGFNRHISLDDNSYRFYPRLCFSSSMYAEFSWNLFESNIINCAVVDS